MTRIILGSGSPSRLALLRRAGLDPIVRVSGVDETVLPAETPVQVVERLAHAKASAVAAEVTEGIVVGCDSLLEVDGEAFGKPGTPERAIEMWRRTSGRCGTFHTGHCVIDAGSRRSARAVSSTSVHFAKLAEEEIHAYVKTGEPLSVAGAFKVDHRGGWYVDRIDGDLGNLQGLSLPLLRTLLDQLGVSVIQIWS